MAKWLIQVVLVTITLKLCASQDPFLRSPTSVNTTYNAEVKFSCMLNLNLNLTNTKAAWEFEIEKTRYNVTDAPFTDGISLFDDYETFDLTIFINISTPINKTLVYCKTAPINSSIPLDGIKNSEKAILLVQGPPGEIEEIYCEQENNWIYFHWDPPYSLQLTNTSLNTQYCVSVTHVWESSIYNETQDLIMPKLNTTTSYNYTFSEDATPCDIYDVTITSHNGPEGNVPGGVKSLIFHRYEAPRNSSTFSISASYYDDSGTFEAIINFDEDIQACTDSCEAETVGDNPIRLNASDDLECSSNQVKVTANKNSGRLMFNQTYNFTITINNGAGSAKFHNIILHISADIISAVVNTSSNFLTVTAIFTSTSESGGTYILLQQYFQDPESREENCGNGIQTNFGQKNGNATVSFSNLSEGEYDLYLLPLNMSNKIFITESGQLNAFLFKYPSKIIVFPRIGQGSFANRSIQELQILNSYLNIDEFQNNMGLILIQKFSSSNSTSLMDSQIVYFSGKESQIKIEDLKNEMDVCLSIYFYEDSIFGAERLWKIVNIETSRDSSIVIIVVNSIVVFIVISIIVILLPWIVFCLCCRKKDQSVFPEVLNLDGVKVEDENRKANLHEGAEENVQQEVPDKIARGHLDTASSNLPGSTTTSSGWNIRDSQKDETSPPSDEQPDQCTRV